jgi:predicted DNA-binding WGR domain protein
MYEMDSKFWEVTIDDCTVTTRWGKQGSNGQTKVEDFSDSTKAQKAADKLIKQKTGKGYELQ